MKDINLESLNAIYQNANIALQSIADLMPEAPNTTILDELKNEYDGYKNYITKLKAFMETRELEPKPVGTMKKAMLYTSIKMNAMMGDSTSELAEMMVKGTLNGIIELRQLVSRGASKVDESVLEQAKTLCALEEKYEKNLKAYL